jgi:hypothetical protein
MSIQNYQLRFVQVVPDPSAPSLFLNFSSTKSRIVEIGTLFMSKGVAKL